MINNEPPPTTLWIPRVVLELGAVVFLAGFSAVATAGTVVVTHFDDVIDENDGSN